MIRPLGGLGLAFTEFVNPRGLMNGSARSIQLIETAPDDRPLTVQLFGTDADELAEAALWVAERGSLTVDINFGCPVPKLPAKEAAAVSFVTALTRSASHKRSSKNAPAPSP